VLGKTLYLKPNTQNLNKMIERRQIRDNEHSLIAFLLSRLSVSETEYLINTQVYEYEGGKMGSISLGEDDATYDSDLIQVEYIDADQTPVVITLTKDTNNLLLDLDFWKTDFSKLIQYPKPEDLIFFN
jgi:hypothetical protein